LTTQKNIKCSEKKNAPKKTIDSKNEGKRKIKTNVFDEKK
jgi:hypothetical protein